MKCGVERCSNHLDNGQCIYSEVELDGDGRCTLMDAPRCYPDIHWLQKVVMKNHPEFAKTTTPNTEGAS